MNKDVIRIFLLVALLLTTSNSPVSAETKIIGDFTYTYNSGGGKKRVYACQVVVNL